MKTHIYLFSIIFSLYSASAQQVQWASKVIKFSSDLGGKQFGIKRILGKPDVFPQGGYSGNAWTPKNALDGREIIIVGYEKPQTVKQVAVFENLNAGCVTRIFVSTDGEKFDAVWSRKANYKTPRYKTTLTTDRSYYFKRKRRKVEEVPDVFNPGIEYAILDNAIANVAAVKVEFSFALLPGQKQIDAIGISDSEIPIDAKINTKPVFDNLPNPESLNFDKEIFNCILTNDGQQLYFTVTENDKDAVYLCQKEANNKWSTPIAQTALNSNERYNYIEYSGADFMIKGGIPYTINSGASGFEFIDKSGAKEPIKITAFNNYEDTADLTITANKKQLILAINTDFTQGGTDLYFTTRKDDGTYGLLQNMGKSINSANDESTPQLLSDTKTLLFSSTGYSSFGDHDIYCSYRLDDTWKNWSEPVNLGAKINGAEFDGSPFYDEKSEILYYIKYNEGKAFLNSVKISKASFIK